jgi:hypothetical protein
MFGLLSRVGNNDEEILRRSKLETISFVDKMVEMVVVGASPEVFQRLSACGVLPFMLQHIKEFRNWYTGLYLPQGWNTFLVSKTKGFLVKLLPQKVTLGSEMVRLGINKLEQQVYYGLLLIYA